MPYHTTTDSVALLEDELKLRQDLANMDYDELVEVIVRNHFDHKKENEELKKQITLLNEHIENLPRPHIGHMIGRNIAVQLKEAKEEIEDLKKQIAYEVGISIEEELKEEIMKLKEIINVLDAEKTVLVEAHKKKLASLRCPEPLDEDLDKEIDKIFDAIMLK